MRKFAILTAAMCAISLTTAPTLAQIQYGESVPVQLESMGDLDPCSLGMITNVGYDSSAMVLTGPSSDYDVVDYLVDDDMVWVCQSDGDMLGVVYAPTGSDMDCELSNPMDFAINYSGPCSTVWVKEDWVTIIAG